MPNWFRSHSVEVSVAGGYTAILAVVAVNPTLLGATCIGALVGGSAAAAYTIIRYRSKSPSKIAAAGSLEAKIETEVKISEEVPQDKPISAVSTLELPVLKTGQQGLSDKVSQPAQPAYAPLEMPALKKPEQPQETYKPKELEVPLMKLDDALPPPPEDYFPAYEAQRPLELPLLKLNTEEGYNIKKYPEPQPYVAQEQPQFFPPTPKAAEPAPLPLPSFSNPIPEDYNQGQVQKQEQKEHKSGLELEIPDL